MCLKEIVVPIHEESVDEMLMQSVDMQIKMMAVRKWKIMSLIFSALIASTLRMH